MDYTAVINAIYSSRLATTPTPWDQYKDNDINHNPIVSTSSAINPSSSSITDPAEQIDPAEVIVQLLWNIAMFLTLGYCVFVYYRKRTPRNVAYTPENIRPGEEYWNRKQPVPEIEGPRIEELPDSPLNGAVPAAAHVFEDREYDAPRVNEYDLGRAPPPIQQTRFVPDEGQEQQRTHSGFLRFCLAEVSEYLWAVLVFLCYPISYIRTLVMHWYAATDRTWTAFRDWLWYDVVLTMRMRFNAWFGFLWSPRFWLWIVVLVYASVLLKPVYKDIRREFSNGMLPRHTPVSARYWSSTLKEQTTPTPWLRWSPMWTRSPSFVGQDPAIATRTIVSDQERLITVTKTLSQKHIETETLTETKTVTETVTEKETSTETKTIVTPEVMTMTLFGGVTRQRGSKPSLSWFHSHVEKPVVHKKEGWWYCSACRQKHCCEFS